MLCSWEFKTGLPLGTRAFLYCLTLQSSLCDSLTATPGEGKLAVTSGMEPHPGGEEAGLGPFPKPFPRLAPLVGF